MGRTDVGPGLDLTESKACERFNGNVASGFHAGYAHKNATDGARARTHRRPVCAHLDQFGSGFFRRRPPGQGRVVGLLNRLTKLPNSLNT